MKQCPYCNAQIDDESKFCSECGKELPQGNVCAHCGATVNEGDIYCEDCGRNLINGSYASADYAEKSGIDYMKILLSSLIGIVVGLVILALVGGGWYGYNAYSEYSAAKQAREKFVSDSLEQVRKDSLRMVELKAKEELDAKKLAEFREKLTINNVLALLKDPSNSALAQKCGLSYIYKDTKQEEGYDEDDVIELSETVYGYDVDKGSKSSDLGYDINPLSEHACYFSWIIGSDTSLLLHFKDKSDADYFLEKAKDYGLVEYGNTYYIPKNSTFKGVKHMEEYEPYENALFGISDSGYNDGWYVLFFYLCDL